MPEDLLLPCVLGIWSWEPGRGGQPLVQALPPAFLSQLVLLLRTAGLADSSESLRQDWSAR